jgi:FAD/FMN-containing dehydrogenase
VKTGIVDPPHPGEQTMNIESLVRLDGTGGAVPQADLDAFAAAFRGRLIQPTDADFDEARAVWNATIDRRPGLIARCSGPADVIAAVRFASRHGILTAVRSGAHNIAGNAVCDGGLVIDLSAMRSVRVDPEHRSARVEAGATLGDLDHETQAFGLAVPVGINSTTGIAGLTLGGGFGWLTRSFGLTVDNLTGVDVVTADGDYVHASEHDHADLFWALRGGGGNFGIVTSFEFRLHPVGPEVLAGPIVHPLSDASAVLDEYRERAASAPDALSVWAVIRRAPPLPFLDESVHGTGVVILALCHAGEVAHAVGDARPFRDIGRPIADAVAEVPFAAFQQAFDPLLTPGARNYWKSHNLVELSDGALDVLIRYAEQLPTDESEIFVGQLGGKAARIDRESTAYPHRDANFVVNVHTRWRDPADDERCIAWARGLFDELGAYATGGVYVNFMPSDEIERVRAAYGGHWDRLTQVKRRYDPDNFFRFNQNIPPRVEEEEAAE